MRKTLAWQIWPRGQFSTLFYFSVCLFSLAFASYTAAVDCQNQKPNTQYILLMRSPDTIMNQARPDTFSQARFEDVLTRLPNRPKAGIQTGMSFIFSPFKTSRETTLRSLTNFLAAAEETSTPILINIDTEQWWQGRPDLWNWWDPGRPGYNPSNVWNVEWTSWSSTDAIKIAWRNWGRQLRVLPPPNLASPCYLEACAKDIRLLTCVCLHWYEHLPESKKHIFVGIKVGWETSIGINAYYYPDGNKLMATAPDRNPQARFDPDDVLARGMQQIGFAALKTSGIRTKGSITESDLERVAQQYLERLCRVASECGVPRDKLFTHGVGLKDGELLYDAAVNKYSCPGWSFYRHADDPMADAGVRRNLERSDAPYWAAAEWWLQKPHEKNIWQAALKKSLADKRCRFVCIYNWEGLQGSEDLVQAIRELVEKSQSR